jgi:hypothetical protein
MRANKSQGAHYFMRFKICHRKVADIALRCPGTAQRAIPTQKPSIS